MQKERNRIERVLSEDSTSKLDLISDFIDDLYRLRQQGMESKDGEYSIENLVFKKIRNAGYLDKLKDIRNKLVGDDLSLEQLQEEQSKACFDTTNVNSVVSQKEVQNLLDAGYSVEEVSIKKLIDDNNLLNSNLGSYHSLTWGKDVKNFKFDVNKINDWGVNIIAGVMLPNGKIKLTDGKHRIVALYNDGYRSVKMLVFKEGDNK